MSSTSVNHLSKEENVYELYLRNVQHTVPFTNIDANAVRKLIRKALKDKLVPSVTHLLDKITLSEELQVVQAKVTYLDNLCAEIEENKLPMKIAKFEAKYLHLKTRLEMLSKVKLTPEQQTLVSSLVGEVKKINQKVLDIKVGVDVSELSKLEETLNKSLIEEEDDDEERDSKTTLPSLSNNSPSNSESNNVQTNNDLVQTITDVGLPVLVTNSCAATSLPSVTTSLPRPENSLSNIGLCVFNKLANPIEKYLQDFRIVNGLDINELLHFLKTLIKLQSLTSLTDSDIIQLIQGFTVSPLLDKVLECKRLNATVKHLHKQIIFSFIPVSLREKMKHDFVYRPQRTGEPLAMYISEVRSFSEVLLCDVPETELVNSIKCGINPEDRSKLVFENNPQSFKDLDSLCIATQNAIYNDFVRARNSSQPSMFPQNNHNIPPKPNVNQGKASNGPVAKHNQSPRFNQPPKCYNCNQVGHLARHCYANKQPKN